MRCIYSNNRCFSIDDKRIKEIYDEDITKFIQIVCSMCIKNRYSRTKERLSKRKIIVVNTL
ncbi:MAG: hypothetical protein QXS19_05855 [Candidatus Methanomethylicia archaeon]